jgi:uncharacterized membrane protein YbhN (UPF0104 family)
MPNKTLGHSILARIIAGAVVVLAGVYVLVRNWHIVQQSLEASEDAHLTWFGVGLGLMVVTFLIAAAIYGTLAQHRLRYRSTVLVEVAAAFVNRLLPAGIGGLGLHGIYLYRQKHTGAEATVVVSANNLIGILAHLLLLAVVLVWDPSLLHRFTTGRHLVDWRIGVFILAVVLAGAIGASRVRSFMRHLLASVRRIHPRRVSVALLLAMLLTATYTLILDSAAHALSVQLNVLQIFIVFSLGMLTSTATPTPGGLVGAEAGLFAGLFAYGVSAPISGAVVLLYRLITYWLPLIPGAVAVVLTRQRRLI